METNSLEKECRNFQQKWNWILKNEQCLIKKILVESFTYRMHHVEDRLSGREENKE